MWRKMMQHLAEIPVNPSTDLFQNLDAPQKMLLGSENRQDMPPKIDNKNEQKLDEYNIDDENEGTFNDFFGFLKKL